MKKIIALIFTGIVFGYQSFTGTKGFGGIYSAFCEDPGTIGFNTRIYGYYESVYHLQEGTTYDVMNSSPFISLSVSLWKYLELSGFGLGYFYYETGGNMTYGIQDYGAVAKGVIPFPVGEESQVGIGILGFASMSPPSSISASTDNNMSRILGYYPFSVKNPEFGALFLMGFEAKNWDVHLNAGYKYQSSVVVQDTSYTLPQWILGGVGIEIKNIKFLDFFTAFNIFYPLESVESETPIILTYPLKTPRNIADILCDVNFGVRFRISSWFDVEISGGLDPLDMQESYYGEIGFSILFNPFKKPAKVLEGIVYDAETKKPIPDAMVIVQHQGKVDTFLTSPSGEFEVEVKDFDAVVVHKKGYEDEILGKEEMRKYVEVYLEKAGAVLQGLVYDAETGRPLDAKIKIISDGEIFSIQSSDPVTGIYKITMPEGEYIAEVFREGYYTDRRMVSLGKSEIKCVDFALHKKPAPKKTVKKSITKRIYFGRGETYPSPKYIPMLEEIAELIKNSPDATVVIEGHTDSVGNQERNYWIGYRRAENVARILASFGVPWGKLHILSAGETQPIGDNRTRSGRALNRRVEIRVTY